MSNRAPQDGRGCRQRPQGRRGRHRRSHLAGLLGILAIFATLPAPALAIERSATPSTFASVFSQAQAGDVVVLASGSYGTFSGGMKAGQVTIKPAAGATASMAISFYPATNITLDGLTITSAYVGDYRTKNITIRNSSFDRASIVFRSGSGGLENANILLDTNTHTNRDVCSGCYDGRISIVERSDQPTGITIQNSTFAGGTMDGILNGGNGVRILNNEFRNIQQTTSGDVAHTDSIQLYGSYGTVIRGNYFHDVAVGIMCADECDREVIEDNIFAVNGSPYAVQLLSDNGSRVVHNTFLDYGVCDYGLRCGVIYLGNKSVDPPSQGTVMKDNIITRACLCSGSTMGLTDAGYNLFTETKLNGTGDLLARPVFVGGSNPQTRDGFRLALGSPGKGSASDGLDRGVRFDGTEAPPPPPPPPPPSPEPAAPTAAYTYAPTSPTAGQSVSFDGAGSTCAAEPCSYAWEDDGPDGAGGEQWPLGTSRTLSFMFGAAGDKHVRLTVTDSLNRSASTVKTITVSAAAPTTPPPPAPTSGDLVASYEFEESGGTVTDGSGMGNTGTVVGARRTTGKTGKALRFDGINDYVTIPDRSSLDLTTGMTLEAWVYPTAAGSARRLVVGKELSASLGYGLYAFDGQGRSLGFVNVRGVLDTASGSAPPLNTWSHLAATYDGTTLRLYLNAGLVGERAVGGSIATSGSPLKIGGNAVWGEWFKGRIDGVRVFNGARSAGEIKADMSAAA